MKESYFGCFSFLSATFAIIIANIILFVVELILTEPFPLSLANAFLMRDDLLPLGALVPL